MTNEVGLEHVNQILQDRGSTYGPAKYNLRVMSRMVEAYKAGTEIRATRLPNEEAHEMAITMIIAKLSRISTGRAHADNYDDIIGYAKIARELAMEADLPEFLKKPNSP